MRIPYSKVKLAVIIGYILVVAIMIIGITSVYQNLVAFSEKKVRNEDLSELIIVGNTISQLYEIESSQNLFNVQSAKTYFEKYDSISPIVKLQIDSLKRSARDEERIIKLDSIEFLLDLKNQNLRDIAVLLDSITKAPRITRETVSAVVPNELNEEIANYLQNQSLITEIDSLKSDTTVVYGDRRGFFDRVKNIFVGRPDSMLMVDRKVAVLPKAEFHLVIDTVVNMVRYSERLNLESQKKFEYILLERQNSMAVTNTHLTAQINALLKSIEQEEISKSLELLQDKETVINKSHRTAYLVSWISVLIALVFGAILLVSINRNQMYINQLEFSSNRISKLLKSREHLMLAVSHDIKAPISSILGYIELMHTDMQPDQKQLYLGNMKNSSEHVLQLVANLLDFHKLESGTMAIREVNVNYHDLANSVTDSFQPIALQKNIIYSVNNQLSKKLVGSADPYVIRQIMNNIISNALKYTFEGEVSVRVYEKKENGNSWFVFQVQDTGIGIDEKDQQVIFEEFHQLNESNVRVEGSGLGLAITKRLIDELDGRISLNSKKGKGSEFLVELPIKAEQKGKLSTSLSSGTSEVDLKNISILLVDDDTVQLKMTSEMLLLRKAMVKTENNPENVENILSKRRFDIVFMDIQMPQINGFELVKRVRDIKRYKTTPIIALSAKSDVSKTDLIDAGFTDFLTKPFTSEKLYSTVSFYVKGDAVAVLESPETEDTSISSGAENLISYVRDDKKTSMEILDAFINDFGTDVQQLDDAFQQNNHEAVPRIAHKILPLIRMINNDELISELEQLEKYSEFAFSNKENLLAQLKQLIEEAKTLREQIENN